MAQGCGRAGAAGWGCSAFYKCRTIQARTCMAAPPLLWPRAAAALQREFA